MVILENIITDPRNYTKEEIMGIIGNLAVADKILYNPIYRQIMSPEFLKKEDQQEEMYNSLPQLRELNISLQDIKKFLNTYINLEKDTLRESISGAVELIIANQKDGKWDEWIKSYDEKFDKANAWPHCVLTRFLIKWKGISKENSDLDKAIKAAISHIEDYYIKENGLSGLERERGSNKINIYDTSFAITTISHFPVDFTKELFNANASIETLLHPDFLKNEGYWSAERGGDSDTGATAYALLSLIHYSEGHSKTAYENQIKKGIEWLEKNQSSSGGWSERGIQDTRARVDRACFALSAIREYKAGEVTPVVKKGIEFLESQLRLTFKNSDCRFWSWLDDDSLKPDIENSSYAISTLLKCDVPYHNFAVENGMIGSFRMLNKDNPSKSLPLYFACSIIDYLKARYGHLVSLKDTVL